MVFLSVHLPDLKYNKDEINGFSSCSYSIAYRLMASYEAKAVIDSMTVIYGDTMNFGKNVDILRNLVFPAVYPGNYILELTLRDLNRKEYVRKYLNVLKSTHNTSQNFLLLKDNELPVFRNYTSKDEKVRLLCADTNVDHLSVRAYFRSFPPASPPFVEENNRPFNYTADSTFNIKMIKGESDLFSLQKEGFYHFVKDTSVREGFTIFRFFEGFPYIGLADQLVYPLKYITTRKEYDTILNAPDQKQAVDEFWLNTAGNPLRAKSLIQKYYNNVEDANHFFTSYQEGWKTDRGLIYVVFGQPNYVYRSENTEEWIYGEPQNRNSLRFTYVKVNNPFTDNDYSLFRSPTMKDAWYITVQSWRR
jgi:GWxTD domain-containing protein